MQAIDALKELLTDAEVKYIETRFRSDDGIDSITDFFVSYFECILTSSTAKKVLNFGLRMQIPESMCWQHTAHMLET